MKSENIPADIKSKSLKEAREEINVILSKLENEKTNLISGLLANHLGAKQSIIHVVTTEFIPTIQEIGAGAVISKNLSTVNAVLSQLHSDKTETPIATFDEIDVDVLEFQPDSGSPITQKPIKDLKIPENSIIGMINHHGKIVIAHGNSQLTGEDIALVFARPDGRSKINKMFIS